ncbi:hypothetical protein BT96DRAFT_994805 [Gymnopus androsaceus JB14]|uniref:Uncharacterized protein n=1 Tax=Gymnopus androsaceus JB14 TaxID=1447944 RepID=A0A6A4HN68_9AGAR|nr:hypothetical protein BT96DRAFT_994805 [Gymnopus androsaceus JB14]
MSLIDAQLKRWLRRSYQHHHYLMLSSLFSKKPQDEDAAESPRRSETAKPILDEGSPKSHPRSLATDLHTPHDAALAELNVEDDSAKAPISASLSSPGPAPISSPREVVRDPFDGSNLGTLVLPDPNFYPEAHKPLSDAASRNEEIWSHLSTVLDLQSQIAGLHLEMEGIGTKSDHGKGKGNRSANAIKRPPVRAASGTAELLDLEHDEGVGVGEDEDEEQKKDREREEDFARLADQFEGRKESVSNIMSKLGELAEALTEFHALQAPSINFPSSRQSSVPVTSTDKLSVPLPSIIPVPYPQNDRSSTNILSPSRMLDSPVSAESHEFL